LQLLLPYISAAIACYLSYPIYLTNHLILSLDSVNSAFLFRIVTLWTLIRTGTPLFNEDSWRKETFRTRHQRYLRRFSTNTCSVSEVLFHCESSSTLPILLVRYFAFIFSSGHLKGSQVIRFYSALLSCSESLMRSTLTSLYQIRVFMTEHLHINLAVQLKSGDLVRSQRDSPACVSFFPRIMTWRSIYSSTLTLAQIPYSNDTIIPNISCRECAVTFRLLKRSNFLPLGRRPCSCVAGCTEDPRWLWVCSRKDEPPTSFSRRDGFQLFCCKNPFYLTPWRSWFGLIRLHQELSGVFLLCQISYAAFVAQSKNFLSPDPSCEPYQVRSGQIRRFGFLRHCWFVQNLLEGWKSSSCTLHESLYFKLITISSLLLRLVWFRDSWLLFDEHGQVLPILIFNLVFLHSYFLFSS